MSLDSQLPTEIALETELSRRGYQLGKRIYSKDIVNAASLIREAQEEQYRKIDQIRDKICCAIFDGNDTEGLLDEREESLFRNFIAANSNLTDEKLLDVYPVLFRRRALTSRFILQYETVLPRGSDPLSPNIKCNEIIQRNRCYESIKIIILDEMAEKINRNVDYENVNLYEPLFNFDRGMKGLVSFSSWEEEDINGNFSPTTIGGRKLTQIFLDRRSLLSKLNGKRISHEQFSEYLVSFIRDFHNANFWENEQKDKDSVCLGGWNSINS